MSEPTRPRPIACAASTATVWPQGRELKSRVRVTTSGDTLVVVPHASVGQLRKGTTIFALGSAGPDGTLAARGVAAVSQLPAGPRLNAPTRGCSPASIAAALVSGG